MKKANKGFTLAELLIVVAIIAVLVAIAIPIFTTQLEKARESTDVSNIRAAYAEVMTAVLTDAKDATSTTSAIYDLTYEEGVYKAEIEKLVQQVEGWQNSNIESVGGFDVGALSPTAGGKCTITYTVASDTLNIAFGAGA